MVIDGFPRKLWPVQGTNDNNLLWLTTRVSKRGTAETIVAYLHGFNDLCQLQRQRCSSIGSNFRVYNDECCLRATRKHTTRNEYLPQPCERGRSNCEFRTQTDCHLQDDARRKHQATTLREKR